MQKEITELENRIATAKAMIQSTALQLAETINQGYGVDTDRFKLHSLNVASWANTLYAMECDLHNLRTKQANEMHGKYIGVIINLSDLAKEINAKANKR